MELFEPQKPPLYKQILKSPTFQVFLVIGLIAAMSTVYLRQTKKPESRPRRIENKIGSPSAPKKQKTNQLKPPKTQSTTEATPQKALPGTTGATEAPPASDTQEAPAPPSTLGQEGGPGSPSGQDPSPPPEGPKTMTEIHVRFAEAPQSALNEMVFKDNFLGSDEYLRAGSYKLGSRLSKITRKIAGLSFLPGTRSKRLPVSGDDPMTFQFLHKGEEPQEYGLQLRLYPQVNSGQLTLDLEGEINLKSVSGENMANSSLQASYTLPQNEVLVIELAIPGQPMDEGHMSALAATPLSIMSRTDFLEGLTSLVILIQTR